MNEILILWQQGHDTYDIAKKMGKTEAYVYNSLFCANSEKPDPKPKKLIKYVGHNNPGKRSAWD